MMKKYISGPHKVIRLLAPVGFGINQRLVFPLLVGVPLMPRVSSSLTMDFILFFLFYFILLYFFFFFLSSIFRTTRVDQSHCHISHKVDGIVTRTDHGTWENEVEGSGIK